MKQGTDDFKTTYVRLKAWRDAIRRNGTQRQKRATPFRQPFSPKSKPRLRGQGNEEG